MARLLEESLESSVFVPLLDNLEGERNRRSFENRGLSIQRLKFLFLCSILSSTNLFIEHSSMSLVNFIDWLGSDRGREYCCFFYPFRRLLYTLYVLRCTPFGVLMQFALTYKRKDLEISYCTWSWYFMLEYHCTCVTATRMHVQNMIAVLA